MCTAAAVFTRNAFQAAPVSITRDMLQKLNGEGISGVVINSGCANAVTGKGGLEDAEKMGKEATKYLNKSIDASEGSNTTMVMSTGVIGQR